MKMTCVFSPTVSFEPEVEGEPSISPFTNEPVFVIDKLNQSSLQPLCQGGIYHVFQTCHEKLDDDCAWCR